MFSDAIGRLRIVGIVEAISFLLLLGVAMPMKYAAGRPEAVQVVGMAHGVLWMLYLIVVAWAIGVRAISFGTALWAVVASVLPFGPIVFDRWFLNEPRPPGDGDATPSAAYRPD